MQPNTGAQPLAPVRGCGDCHRLDPSFNSEFGVRFPGLFGSDGNSSYLFEPMIFKNPHLRNQYQKVGMFGNPPVDQAVLPGDNDSKGDQVRGFGFSHDGSTDTGFRFVSALFFAQDPYLDPTGIPISPDGDAQRRDLEQFMLGFPSNLAPVVGQQVTLFTVTAAVAGPRLDLFESAASAGQCDLVAKARTDKDEHGFLFTPAGYLPDSVRASVMSSAAMRALATSVPVTFTCVPPGSGRRIGIVRDLDGILDGDE
jgi:hypothetical protein